MFCKIQLVTRKKHFYKNFRVSNSFCASLCVSRFSNSRNPHVLELCMFLLWFWILGQSRKNRDIYEQFKALLYHLEQGKVANNFVNSGLLALPSNKNQLMKVSFPKKMCRSLSSWLKPQVCHQRKHTSLLRLTLEGERCNSRGGLSKLA